MSVLASQTQAFGIGAALLCAAAAALAARYARDRPGDATRDAPRAAGGTPGGDEIDPAASWQRAEERARRTLMEHLSERQRTEYEQKSAFTVVAASGNTYYLSRDDIVARIAGRIARLCILPRTREPIPAWDVVLARKLMIEADEQSFLTTAKRWPWPNMYQ